MPRVSFLSFRAVKWIAGGLALALLAYMVYGLAVAIQCKGIASSEAAGWMQAIGSFVAIGAAILVAYLQAFTQDQQAAKRDQQELAGMLDCLLCELELVKKNALLTIDAEIRATNDGQPVCLHYPVSESPFRIYEGFIQKLGIIGNKSLRVTIVEAYTYAASFVYTIRYNNELFGRWETQDKLHRSVGADAYKNAAAIAMVDLQGYGDGVRNVYFLAIDSIDRAILALRNLRPDS